MDMFSTVTIFIGSHLLKLTLEFAVLIVCIAFAERLLRRTSAAFRYLLWFVVLVRIATPFNLPLPEHATNWLQDFITKSVVIQRPSPSQEVEPSFATQPFNVEQSHDAKHIGTSEQTSVVEQFSSNKQSPQPLAPQRLMQTITPRLREMSPPLVSSVTQTLPMPVTGIIGLIWMVVVGVLFISIIIRWLLLRRMVGHATNVQCQEIIEAVAYHAQVLGLSKSVDVRVWSSYLETVALAGVFKPCILMPSKLVEKWSIEEIEPVLLHELAHVKRYDLMINWLQVIVQAMYFFNPLVWYANYRMRCLREEACDDLALASLNGSRKRYVESILRIIDETTSKPSFGFAAIGFAERRSNIGERIRRIMKSKGNFATRLTSKAICGFMAIGLFAIALSGSAASLFREPDKIEIAVEEPDRIALVDRTKVYNLKDLSSAELSPFSPEKFEMVSGQGFKLVRAILDDDSITSDLVSMDSDTERGTFPYGKITPGDSLIVQVFDDTYNLDSWDGTKVIANEDAEHFITEYNFAVESVEPPKSDISFQYQLAANTTTQVNTDRSNEPLDPSVNYITVEFVNYTEYEINGDDAILFDLEQTMRKHMVSSKENALIVKGLEELLPPAQTLTYYRIDEVAKNLGIEGRVFESNDDEIEPSDWPVGSKFNPIMVEVYDEANYLVNDEPVLRDELILRLDSLLYGSQMNLIIQGASGREVFEFDLVGNGLYISNEELLQVLDLAEDSGFKSFSLIKGDKPSLYAARSLDVFQPSALSMQTGNVSSINIPKQDSAKPFISHIIVKKGLDGPIIYDGDGNELYGEKLILSILDNTTYLINGEEIYRDDLERIVRENAGKRLVIEWHEEDTFESYAYINNTISKVKNVSDDGISNVNAPSLAQKYVIEVIDEDTIKIGSFEMDPEELTNFLKSDNSDTTYGYSFVIRADADMSANVIYEIDQALGTFYREYEVY